MGRVFERYPTGGGEFVLALALADNAHDDGTRIFPSVAQLARKTRQSERSVQYQLRAMEKSGWLVLVKAESRAHGRPREYRIDPAWLLDAPPGAKTASGEVQPPGAIFAPGAAVDKPPEPGAEIAPGEQVHRVQSFCTPPGAKLLHPNRHITIKKSFSDSRPVEKPQAARRLDAGGAWRLAREWMAKGERPPAWPDPRIEPALQELGGFYHLSQKTTTALDWLGRDFAQAFDAQPVSPAKPSMPTRSAA